jgi:hypothetical protein
MHSVRGPPYFAMAMGYEHKMFMKLTSSFKYSSKITKVFTKIMWKYNKN